ncbi:uncharacterized protein I206_102077 [Kwoniella pini CBS 10737]|uniref:Mitochondrial import receptor subunit tom22 n=1 Tax=Kwoniella pini CBS 10737 TaxID=1296096 RepID=A0A1B9HUW1_9TREE|nr:mitochondrial import receptor subunit tom22 [Kwoniella pini CBS 10737]OCF47056.1 mitochondrial import receptor subunit tom22 [Kwoniella pini CBS 10737]
MVVVVEEVQDESAPEVSQNLGEGERESDYETDSEVSSTFSEDLEDDFNPDDETYYERLVALKDIVPPQTRSILYSKYQTTASWASWTIQSTGTLAWWISTSALLVGLPLALAIEDETRVVQQEREMQMQSQGQQQLLGGPQQGQPQGVLPPGF